MFKLIDVDMFLWMCMSVLKDIHWVRTLHHSDKLDKYYYLCSSYVIKMTAFDSCYECRYFIFYFVIFIRTDLALFI